MGSKIVIGKGWAALMSVAKAVTDGAQVEWVWGSGSRLDPVLPFLERGVASSFFQSTCEHFGVDLGNSETGILSQEFKNKSLRALELPTLSAVEARFYSEDAIRYDLDLGLAFNCLLEKLTDHPSVRITEQTTIQSIDIEGVLLGSGEKIAGDAIYYADKWSLVSAIAGIPKALPLLRGTTPCSVVQVVFQHIRPFYTQWHGGLCLPSYKDAGDEGQKNVLGYLVGGEHSQVSSVWSVILGPHQDEDNHEIAKKIRKLKQTLDRTFAQLNFLGPGMSSFMSNVQSERVRFEESAVFAESEANRRVTHFASLPQVQFLTDAYGVNAALAQVFDLNSGSYTQGNQSNASSSRCDQTLST